jgi:hypothetical protein
MNRLLFYLSALLFISACGVTHLPLQVNTGASQYVEGVQQKTFSNFHGLQTTDNTVQLEGEGMLITIEKVDLPPEERSLNKIKNAYMPAGDIYQFERTTFAAPSLVLLGGDVIVNQYTTSALLFIFPAPDSSMFAITVESAFMLDFERAAELVKDIEKNGMPEYVITQNLATEIDFVGRPITLGNVCEWQKPHTINCTGLGELYWSLYQTADDANMARQINMAITEAQSEEVLEKDENVKVEFEGTPMVATKVVYRLDGGTRSAYYISTLLRGHYIFCKVAFTDADANGQKLSPLAAKIIAL